MTNCLMIQAYCIRIKIMTRKPAAENLMSRTFSFDMSKKLKDSESLKFSDELIEEMELEKVLFSAPHVTEYPTELHLLETFVISCST